VIFKDLRLSMLAALCLAAPACGGGDAPPAAGTVPAGALRVDASKAGTIRGRIAFQGPVPSNAPVKLDSDPACASQHPGGLTLDTTLVSNGGLDNVFVYIRDGLGRYHFDTPATPVTIDQKGCRYAPHVVGVRTGQPIEIGNSDPTMHNVHAMGKINQEFNFAQAFQGIRNTKTFTAPEVMVHLKCNVHNWMSAYVGVLDHPYFAVTAGGGAFELTNVPAGAYTIEAWHETLGTETASVTVGERESKSVDFRFVSK
jgi:plastocyanin